MDPYMESIDKHLINFNQFAGQFTNVFIPIVDKAIKMSTQEPVSAYSVFKAAKDLAGNKNKSKKNQKNTAKDKNANKTIVKKLASAPAADDSKAVSKLKDLSMNGHRKGVPTKKGNTINTKPAKGKDLQMKQKTTAKTPNTHNFKGTEVISLVEQLYTDDSKKLTKALHTKKKDLEEYLVKQLEMDDAEGDASFESEGLQEEDVYFDSEIYSDEYTINGSDSFLNDEVVKEASSSTNEDDQAGEALPNSIISKACKRKKSSPDAALTKAKTNRNTINGISKAKKSKKTNEPVAVTRKSLPAAQEPCHQRSSLASIDTISQKLSKSATEISTVANVKLTPLSPPANIVKLNSINEGKRAFKWLLNPVKVDDFFAAFWERKACFIKRNQSTYYRHLISFEAIDEMLLKNHVEFTKNIDVTSYKNGFRETLNPEGRALPPVVWDHYGQGCSIRLLNPQTFIPALFTLSTTMQEYFQCLVGANAYLTPPNSQGFAPHYDDIEAFVLQIEGRKRWKLYKPRNVSEILPRHSSKNFTQQEIGEPVFEEILEPGDVLYFPRGTIHQACTEPGYHSLHITLSVYQKQSFADLFEKMLPTMLQKAIATNVEIRKGLPLHVWQHAGIAFSQESTKERADLTKKVTQLMHKCIRDMPLQEIMDAAIDQLAKKFQHEALPPEILPAEKLHTVFGSRNHTNDSGECVCDYDIDERTNVRLLRANILRLVEEEGKLRIYYYLDNSKEYCEYEPNFIEIEAMEAASVEVLIKSYPQYVGVSQLPLPSNEHQINLATALWERGLLMMEKPLT